MDDIILEVSSLPEPLASRIPCGKVKVEQVSGGFMLIPVTEKTPFISKLAGILSGTGLTMEDFISQKSRDKELEG